MGSETQAYPCPLPEGKGEIYQLVSDDEIIDKEIQYPVEHHISTAARRISKQLLWHPFGKRTIEKVDEIGDYLRKSFHAKFFCGAKVHIFW